MCKNAMAVTVLHVNEMALTVLYVSHMQERDGPDCIIWLRLSYMCLTVLYVPD
jgi:hypothetical protein